MNLYAVWRPLSHELARCVEARSANEAARISAGEQVRYRCTLEPKLGLDGTRIYIPVRESEPVICTRRI